MNLMKNNKTIILTTAIVLFLIGLSTGHYKHFPFSFFNNIKNLIINETNGSDLYSGRYYKATYQTPISSINITNNTGVYLTYGQSNSANFGEIGYEVKKDVYHSFIGNIYEYQDPIIGSHGSFGSVWGMVGDKLIAYGLHDKVIFSNCGWGNTKIDQLYKDDYLGYLVLNYNALIQKFGKVDAILFHQGESNNNESLINYYSEFNLFLNNLKENGIEIPIYLSRVSLCGIKRPSNKTLIDIQNKIINDYDLVNEGPNTDYLFESKYRLPDNCHFSLLGFEKFSEMWIEALDNK